jgi:hypothetical protein
MTHYIRPNFKDYDLNENFKFRVMDRRALPDLPLPMDLVRNTVWHAKRFRTLNIFNEGVREALALEVDTSLLAKRAVRVLEPLREGRGPPCQIRVGNGPNSSLQSSTTCSRESRRRKPISNA